MDKIADQLIKKESLDQDEFEKIVGKKSVDKPVNPLTR